MMSAVIGEYCTYEVTIGLYFGSSKCQRVILIIHSRHKVRIPSYNSGGLLDLIHGSHTWKCQHGCYNRKLSVMVSGNHVNHMLIM